MLSHLLEVDKGVLETLADGGHATQGRALQLLALEQRLRVFDQADIVSRHRLDQVLRG